MAHVLVLHPVLPRPDQCSGDHQLVQLIGLLRRAGHAVTVVAYEQLPDRDERARYAAALAAWDVETCELLPRGVAAPAWSWEAARPRLRALLDRGGFDVALVNFWNLAGTVVPYLRQAAPAMRIVVHSWDVQHLRDARGAALAGDLRRLRQTAAVRHQELCTYGLADAVLAVTDTDRDVIAAGLREEQDAGRLPEPWREPPPVLTVTHAHAVAAAPPPFAARRGALFVGYFVHPPNVDAALWLGREIWPRVARRLPRASLRVVGAHAPPAVQALAGRGVEIAGFVPDLDPLLDAARVAVAPLRYGAGLKGKVTQAMAAGLPIVTTPCGAEGLPAVHGRHLLIGRDERELAVAIADLHEDPALWQRLSDGGRALIEARCGETVVAATLFAALFGELPAAAPAPALPDDVAALRELLLGLEWEHYRRTPSLALDRYAAAARLDPALAAAHLATASLELALGEQRRAEEALRRARRLAPELPGALPVQAALHAAANRPGPALQAAEKALARDPRDPDALRARGAVLLAAGRREAALEALTAARQAAPDDLAIHADHVRALLAAGQGAPALAQLGQGIIAAARSGQDRAELAMREQLARLLDAAAPVRPPGADEAAVDATPTSAPAAAAAGVPARPPVSIVVLAHNARSYVRRCLAALRDHTPEPHEVILVDNASTDGVRDDLREFAATHPACRLIESDVNLGYAAGNNLGLAAARGGDVVLLNSDVVVTPGWLGRLVACAEREPRAGLVGPCTNRISGPQQVAAAYDEERLDGLAEWAAAFARERAGRARAHWRAVGFCLLIRREVIERVGGLDPRFGRGNFEDDDYCLRALLAGYVTYIADDCFVHHFAGRSFAAAGVDLDASLRANWEIFKAKWDLPAAAPYGEPVDMGSRLARGFDPARDFVPLAGAPASAATAAGAAAGPGRPGADELVARGEAAFRAGQARDAAELFHAALAADPGHARAGNDLACALWSLGEVEPAMAALGRVLAADPDDRDAVWNLGQFLDATGRRADAARLYAGWTARHPADDEFTAALRAWSAGAAPAPAHSDSNATAPPDGGRRSVADPRLTDAAREVVT